MGDTPDTDIEAATEFEAKAPPRWPMPANTQEILHLILAHGNECHTNAKGEEVAGDGIRHVGPVLPNGGNDVLALAMNGLLGSPAGRYPSMCTTRLGRHVARTGTTAGFDDSVTDLDLAAWGRGDLEYDFDELIEAVETFHHELAISRAEVLVVLLKRGVVSVADCRRDV
jgi:hypothetical protein